jgi:hypothetical protein
MGVSVMMAEVRDIVREVAAETGIPAYRIISPERTVTVVDARHRLILRLYHTGRSMSHIARLIGRDHSTIWHFIRKTSCRPRWRKPRVKTMRGDLALTYRRQFVKELTREALL